MNDRGFLCDEELGVDPDGIDPELQRRMAIHACGFAVKQDDPKAVARDLLDMLGLRGES